MVLSGKPRWEWFLLKTTPLRTVLLWEHSEVAILAVVNAILAFGSHSKVRENYLNFIIKLLIFCYYRVEEQYSSYWVY